MLTRRTTMKMLGLAAAPLPGDATRESRMKWWHDARFGMFIHWGLYSPPAGMNGSWRTKASR